MLGSYFFQVIQFQLNIPDKVMFRRRWSIIEHICNKRTDLPVLFPQYCYAKLNLLTYVYILSYIRTWLKRKDKKVQDPVHITSNWISVLFNTPANPFVPGRWVSWEGTFSSWWDNKVWSPFWYAFFCQTLCKTNHTANCIVQFWIRECCWSWGPFSKCSFSGKIIGFLTERRNSPGYQL